VVTREIDYRDQRFVFVHVYAYERIIPRKTYDEIMW